MLLYYYSRVRCRASCLWSQKQVGVLCLFKLYPVLVCVMLIVDLAVCGIIKPVLLRMVPTWVECLGNAVARIFVGENERNMILVHVACLFADTKPRRSCWRIIKRRILEAMWMLTACVREQRHLCITAKNWYLLSTLHKEESVSRRSCFQPHETVFCVRKLCTHMCIN